MKAKDINFAAMLQIAVRILTAPAESFREMPKKGGFLEPLVFALVMAAELHRGWQRFFYQLFICRLFLPFAALSALPLCF